MSEFVFDPQTTFISYIYFSFIKQERFTVGLLSLDYEGYPTDFRFSSPVTPSAMQIALYGENLDSWLIKAVSNEILKELPNKPQAFITNFKQINPKWFFNLPIFYLERSSESNLINLSNSENTYAELIELLKKLYKDIAEPFKRIEEALALIPKTK